MHSAACVHVYISSSLTLNISIHLLIYLFACSSTTVLYQKYTACSLILINVWFALVEVRDLIL